MDDTARPPGRDTRLAHQIIALRTALKADAVLENALRQVIAGYVREQGVALSDALAAALVLAVPAEVETIRPIDAPKG